MQKIRVILMSKSKYLWLIWHVATRPYWAWGWLRQLPLFSPSSRKPDNDRLVEYEKYQFPMENIMQRVSAISLNELKALLDETNEITLNREVKASGIPSSWDATNGLALLCYVVVRAKKPLAVVEAGVARGVTSFYILKALEKNGQGHLFSIDLPILKKESEQEVGILVPESLRFRWTLSLGLSTREMKKMRKNIKKIDLFIHDSDHTYRNQRSEYAISLDWLNKNGVLISDDVSNNALLESYEKYGGELMVTRQKKGSYIGILKV
jgi:predicted O-methyltransferase YrrM